MIKIEIEFKSYDSDINSRVRLSALMKHFQQLAREDFDSFGCTYPQMREMGLVFVLTSMTIKIFKPINLYGKYTIETIPRKTAGVRFYRDFYLYDEEGLVCEAVSVWALIDFVSRRLARPTDLHIEIPNNDAKEPSVEPVKKVFPKDVYDFSSVREVYYSLLDENNHLNNCNYADLIEDTLPMQYHTPDKYISYIGINFVNEAKVGSQILVNIAKENENTLTAVADNKTEEKPCFTSMIEFSDI